MMTKYVVAAIGTLAIVVGGIDWAVGALVSHSRLLIITGAIAIAVAGFLHRWQKLQNPKWPLSMALAIAIFGAADICTAGIHDVLIRPEVTPMIQRSLVNGLETWVIIGVIVSIGLAWIVIFRFIRNRDDRAPAM